MGFYRTGRAIRPDICTTTFGRPCITTAIPHTTSTISRKYSEIIISIYLTVQRKIARLCCQSMFQCLHSHHEKRFVITKILISLKMPASGIGRLLRKKWNWKPNTEYLASESWVVTGSKFYYLCALISHLNPKPSLILGNTPNQSQLMTLPQTMAQPKNAKMNYEAFLREPG